MAPLLDQLPKKSSSQKYHMSSGRGGLGNMRHVVPPPVALDTRMPAQLAQAPLSVTTQSIHRQHSNLSISSLGSGPDRTSSTHTMSGISWRHPFGEPRLTSSSSSASSTRSSTRSAADIESRMVSAGRGGLGNAYPERQTALFSFDEELELRGAAAAAPVVYIGRGGSGNRTSSW